ncbi:MAG: DEAD/DEAH box helicase [Candidatus Methanomethylicia archaeon]
MNTFQELNKKLREIIYEYGYVKPTEPQEKAIPKILNGENVLIIAPTGSGKTEAALFPIMNMIMEEKTRGIRAIYITPLRALNRDIFKRMTEIAGKLGINIEVRHGDTPEAARRRQAIKPPQILITTPETLQAILPGKIMKKHLSHVKHVIIDEIHEFISDKRGVQLAIALERLREICGRMQRIGLSATISNKETAAKFLVGKNGDVEIIDASGEKIFQINVETVLEREMDRVDSEKLGIPSNIIAKLKRIIEIASSKENRSILLFTNTREAAEALATIIKKLNPPFKIGIHHGSLSREERMRVENEFKNGEIKLLICTSSLELGIDIGVVDHVIQYTSPRQTINLIQRVGRAKHKLWETSTGTIITSTVDDTLESIVIAKNAMEKRIEDVKMHEKALDVMAHQMVGLILDKGEISISEIKNIIGRSYPYRNISEEEIEEVALFLSEIGLVRYYSEDKILKARRKRTWQYYYENLSVIPDIRKFTVISIENRKPIGNLDEDFIVIHGREPFILAGKTWNIVNVDEDELKVYVEYLGEEMAAIPAWIGELIPVKMVTAMEAANLREEILRGNVKGYPVQNSVIEYVRGELEKHRRLGIPIPNGRRLIVEGMGKIIIIHTPLGTNGNRALSAIISLKIIEKLRMNIRSIYDPYRIAIITPNPINPESIAELIKNLDFNENEIIRAIKNTSEYKWKLFHSARRMGVISREAKTSVIERVMPYLEDTVVDKEALRESLQDYFEIEAIEELMKMIKSGDVEIEVFRSSFDKEVSPLTKQILIQALPQGLLPPTEAPLNLMEIVKERLQNREMILACAHCRKWMNKQKVRYIPEDIRCPKCGAKAIGTTHREDILKILDKWARKVKLNEEDEKDIENFRKSVGLIMSYGKKAIIAMAARGVGPTVASRILRQYQKTEEEFYLNILEAEKEYLRTRMFWSE